MKRTMCLFALAAVVFALPASHLLFSGPSKKGQTEEVAVCHIQGKEKGPDGPVDKTTGVLLSVSEKAAAHHVAHHNDCTGKEIKKLKGGSCECNNCEEKCQADYKACVKGCGGVKKCIAKCSRVRQKCLKICKVIKPPTKG